MLKHDALTRVAIGLFYINNVMLVGWVYWNILLKMRMAINLMKHKSLARVHVSWILIALTSIEHNGVICVASSDHLLPRALDT